ncbi:MAG: kelch repeat-containing protein [Spirochaetota bacterium]
MRKVITSMLVVSVLALTAYAERPVRIAVLTFSVKGPVSTADAAVIEELMRSELVVSGKFDLLDRANMAAILKEHELAASGCTETDCAVKAGKLLSVERMCYGSFMKLGTKYFISAGMVDVETSRVVAAAREEIASIEKADEAVKRIVTALGASLGSSSGVPGKTGRMFDGRQWNAVYRPGQGPFSARSGHALTVFNGRLWLTGGYEPATTSTLRDVWQSPDGTNWHLVAGSANYFDRNRHAMVPFHNALWIVGGFQANSGGFNGSMNDVWRSIDGTNWTQSMRAAAFTVREGHAIVPFADALWLIGGFSFRENTNDVIRSVNGSNWVSINSGAPFPARNEHTAFVLGDSLYLAAGRGDDRKAMNDVWRTKDGKQWTRVSMGAFTPRFGACSVVLGSTVYLIGGSDGKRTMNDVWTSSDGVSWKNAGETPFPARYLFTAALFRDRIWMLGGSADNGNKHCLNDIWCSE